MTLFNRRSITALSLGFLTVIILANLSIRYVCSNIVTFDCPQGWPVSLFFPQIPTVWSIVLALALSLLFLPVVRLLDERGYRLPEVIALALVLVIGTNALAGIKLGYNEPMTHRDEQYYNDALTINNPVDFLSDYNAITPTLGQHGQTHPPGAILTIYAFERIFRTPEVISLAVGIVSMVGSLFFVYGIFLMMLEDRKLAGFGALLFGVLPAVQIYYIASIDALITTLIIGTLYFYLLPEHNPAARISSTLGAIACLFWAFFMTFPTVIILPILWGYELFRHKRVWRAALITGIVLVLLLNLKPLFGYDYIESFRYAENYENPEGLALLINPANYFFTRLEGIAEILVFFGPFLIVLALRGWPALRKNYTRETLLLVMLILTLLAVFLVGTFRTGETARPLMFLYVIALYPVLAYLRDKPDYQSVLMLVFTQTVYMQLLGIYLW